MKEIKYAMVGCGMMGQEHLRNLELIDGAKVAAIFEPDEAMSKIAQDLAPHAQLLNSFEQLLEQEDIEALVITSPNYLHARQLEAIFQKNRHAILVEKPVVTALEQVNPIRQKALNHSAPIWVGMEYRYMPPIAKLIDLVKGGTLGTLSMVTIREHRFPFLEKVGNWNRFNRNTGGTLVEKCCHHFNLMQLLIGAKAIRVMASAGMDVNHLSESYEGETPDILDNAYVIIEFETGQRAMLELCMFAEGSRYQEEITVVGSKAKVEALVPGPGRFWNRELGPEPTPKVIVSPRHPTGPQEMDIPVDPNLLAAGDHNGSTYYQHCGFFDVLQGKGQVQVSMDDGLKAVVLGLAAQHSAQSGKTVTMKDDGFSYHL